MPRQMLLERICQRQVRLRELRLELWAENCGNYEISWPEITTADRVDSAEDFAGKTFQF